jgi:hypothetical protein
MAAEIPSSSITIFMQSTAQTGWTKLTDLNDYTLRIVSGTTSTGGSSTFSSTFTSRPISGSVTGAGGQTGSTTLSTAQIWSHTHPIPYAPASVIRNFRPGTTEFARGASIITISTNSEGGSLGHNHNISASVSGPGFTGNALNMAVKYVDVIRAQRN